MKKVLTTFLTLAVLQSGAQFRMSATDSLRMDSIRKATQQDYNRTLQQLGITSTRPGPSGNPQAVNAANTDESKASPYTALPDPLTLKNGKKVADARTWWAARRAEIAEDFDREVYGRMPASVPPVQWQVVAVKNDTVEGIPAVTKQLLGRVDNSGYPQLEVAIQMTLTTPAAAKAPVPVMINLGFQFPPGFRMPANMQPSKPTWQEQVLQKGWGYAVLIPTSFQADNGAGLRQGIIGLVNKGQPRKPDDWGTLRAWAWGVSRAVDYLEGDKDVDA